MNRAQLRNVTTFKVKQGERVYTINTVAPVNKINEAVEFSKQFDSDNYDYIVMFLNNEGYATTIIVERNLMFEF